MKNKIIILLLIILTFGCKNDKKTQLKNQVFLSAQIDGKNFYTKDVKHFSANNIISIAGTSNDKTESIKIYIEYKNGTTTYNFGKGSENANNMVYTKNKKNWVASKINGNGTIKFTEKGAFLLGEFSFKGKNKKTNDTKQISNGTFKIKQ